MPLYSDPSSSLTVYVNGDNDEAYTPGIIPNGVGSLEDYIQVVLCEVATKQISKNKLAAHHPNLVAVNMLLSKDFQLAIASRGIPELQNTLPPNCEIDAVTISVVGIDERLTK